MTEQTGCFKPCSNWNTFNTLSDKKIDLLIKIKVLNLVINGIPSIQKGQMLATMKMVSFKPCYKWNTFNTVGGDLYEKRFTKVLNLIINGIPSIQNLYIHCGQMIILGFKPCYKWTAFNTEKEGYIVNVFFLF